MTTYEINRDHSQISFAVDYMVLSQVQGQFQEFQGRFSFDPLEKVLKDVVIDISSDSLFTNNKMRDNHLKKFDFLYSNKYPSIQFRVLQGKEVHFYGVGPKDKAGAFVIGQLTLKGVTRPVNILIHYLGQRNDTWGKESLFFKFKTALNRKDFKIFWNKTLDKEKYLIGDIVEIGGYIQAQVAGKKTVGSRHLIPDTKQIRLRERFSRGEITYGKTGLKVPLPPELGQKKQISRKEISKSTKTEHDPSQDLNRIISAIVVGFFGLLGTILSSFSLRMLFLSPSDKKNTKVELITSILVLVFSYAFSHAFYILVFR